MKSIGIAVAAIFGLLAIVWLVQGNGFFLYKTFAPQYESVRRETFEQSKAYRQGMVQELENMQLQYVQADPEHKVAIGSIVLHRAADFPEADMPESLRSFIRQLKADRGLVQ